MAPSSRYQSWITQLPLPWMARVGQKIWGAFANVLGDFTLDWGTQANLEHLPSYADPQAIPLIAAERQMDTYTGEPVANLAARLPYWLQINQFRGRWLGLLLGLHYSGFDNAVILQQNGLAYQLTLPLPPLSGNWDPTPNLVVSSAMVLPTPSTPVAPATKVIPTGTPWWTIDSNTDFCSRFMVLFPTPTQWAGGTPTAEQVLAIKAAIAKWKPAKATPTRIVVQQTGLLWGWPLNQVWGAGTGNWGGTTTNYSYP